MIKKLDIHNKIDKQYTKEVPQMTAYNYMKQQNQDNLNTTAINYYGNKTKFKDFIDQIDETARRLYNFGIFEGDVITVMSITTKETEVLFYALNKLGAIINLIDVRSNYKQIKKYLEEVESSVVVVMDNFLPEFDKCMEDEEINALVEKVITLSPFNSVPFPFKVIASKKAKNNNIELYTKIEQIKQKEKYISWNDMMNTPKYSYPHYPRFKPNSTIALVHTGGTTGIPKTVKLSNENFNAMALQYQSLCASYNKGDTFLNGIVPFVAYGIVVTIHMPMCLGMTNIIAPILSPKEFTDFMIKYKPNHTIAEIAYVEDFITNKKADTINWQCLKNLELLGDVFTEETEIRINNFLKEHNSLTTVKKDYAISTPSEEFDACQKAHIISKDNSIEKLKPLKEESPLTLVAKTDYQQVEKIKIKTLEKRKK